MPLNYKSIFLLTLKLISRLRMNYLTFKSILAANRFITSSHKPFIFIKAYLSKGVDCKFTIISFPFFPTCFGTSAAGVTVNELPIAKHKSAFYASSNERLISYYGRFYPKFMIESYRVPLHFSHFLEVS